MRVWEHIWEMLVYCILYARRQCMNFPGLLAVMNVYVFFVFKLFDILILIFERFCDFFFELIIFPQELKQICLKEIDEFFLPNGKCLVNFDCMP